MAELISKLNGLLQLPSEIHWFCGRSEALQLDANGLTHIETEDSAGEDANKRIEVATVCLELYAYEDANRYQEAFSRGRDRQLARCDNCTVEYYKARRRFEERLRHDYDEEAVSLLEQKIDEHDLGRIERALDRVERRLQVMEPARRKKSSLDKSERMGLFEALCNRTFLTDDFLLSKHFQGPFNLVQTNKRLSITYYVPAATIFLFEKHYERRTWATSTWSGYLEKPTREDFDFAIRDALLCNMQSVVHYVSAPEDLERVWNGIGIIVGRLDNDLVTHSLRALEIDVFLMALDHLKYDMPGFRQLIQTIQKLLEIAPRDFWNAMGHISPTTYVEQIFNNAQLDKIVEQAKVDDGYEKSPLRDMLSWIKPFMASLETVHQARACHSICFQLLDRLQADRFPQFASVQCYRVGLAVLGWTLRNCSKDGPTLTPTGRIVATETLEVVGKYIKGFLKIPSLPTTDPFREECGDMCLNIVKISLAQECKSLRADQEALNQHKELPEGSHSYATAVWDAVVLQLDRGNVAVAKAALVAINELMGLEKFNFNADETYNKERSGYNVRLGRLTHIVCQILERINDFHPADLDKLFRHSDSATALVSSLFSPDANLYQAGINLIKSISSESARREAIGHLLKTFFETTLNAFSWSIKRIANNRTYASCPRMMKTSTDILDILCDSQDGLLRTRGLESASEIKALESFWRHQWEGLWVIYEMTEDWSKAKVADTKVLMDFCRETMQFSERLFDQYSVFASAIDSAIAVKTEPGIVAQTNEDVAKELLKQPTSILQNTVKWLRLKDLLLVDIAVNLTKKMLGRLTEVKMTVASEPSEMLQQMVNNARESRTNLAPQQKAELARALEANLGRPISSVQVIDLESPPTSDRSYEQSIRPTKMKKATTIDLEGWRRKAKQAGKITEISDDEFGDSDIPDSDFASVIRSTEMMDKTKMSRKNFPVTERPREQDGKTSRLGLPQRLSQRQIPEDSKVKAAEMTMFREKREKERQAKKKRDAETLALLKRKAAGGGDGSGVRGLGLKGKDHAPKGPSMMVSSGSESCSEEEIDHELFGGVSKVKAPNPSKYYEAGTSGPLKAGPVKKIRQVRSSKDMRARLAPDLTQLHKTILGWDFFHDGVFPPGSDRQDYSFVTNTFKTPIDYQNVFEPLLILEAWQGILKSRDEGTFKTFEIKVASRMNVDAFLELSTTIPLHDGKDLGVSEADIILISRGQSPTSDPQQPHCLARVYKINRRRGTLEITYRTNVGNPLVASMIPNVVLYGAKVESITPLEREYGALLGLKYFDLCDEITRAKPSPLLTYTESQLSSLIKVYDVNQAQAKAVRSAVENDAFTLIQGPPGSGKTKTIVAIVGALLTKTLIEKDRGVPIARPINALQQRPVNAEIAAKKLLVCAPSNAAVDELVMRFKQGVKNTSGSHERINVVRLGRSEAVNANVLDVTLEELVNAKLNLVSGKKTGSGEEIGKVIAVHRATCEEFNSLRDAVDVLKAAGKPITPEQNRDFEVLKRKKQQLSTQIDQLRDSGNTAAREAEINRRRAQQEVLDHSHVICATLSGSGHEMFQSLSIEFETVIIDEAAQSIELSALIPLKYGCSKCILVGDPKQLPPTVLSREAARFQYEQSLFVRMQFNHPADVHLLDTQYRMHPEISLFPSTTFYESKLLDGPCMANLRRRPWHQSDLLGPYRFFDVLGTHQSAPRGHSLINVAEIEVALKLYERLVTDCKGYDFAGKVGIITPYKSQLRELRSRFTSKYGDPILTAVEFNTTDAFQGRESEIIIFSCVRASLNQGIGFLNDIRRMNVGITRAKSSLWVLGNSQSLMKGEFWGRLIQDAKSRNRFTGGDFSAMLSKPLLDPQKLATPQATGDHDIEMPDADAAIIDDHSSQNKRSSALAALYDKPPAQSRTSPYEPSGGVTGLNEKNNCAKCGSFAHVTTLCDNAEALELNYDLCFRCGKPGCRKDICKELRCTTCGRLGHIRHTCTISETLPKKEQHRLQKLESDHTLRLAGFETEKSVAYNERKRRNQLGEHDKPVPAVRSASSEVDADMNQKRKRGPSSPPLGAPKGPKLSYNANRHREPQLVPPMPTDPQLSTYQLPPRLKSGTQVPNQPNPIAKPLPPKSTASNHQPNPLPPGGDTYSSGSNTTPWDPGPTPTVIEEENTPLQSIRGGGTVIRQGDGPNVSRGPRPPIPPQNMPRPSNVRAPKRKKDADPFIRPKKK